METETTPLASRVPRTSGILWSNTKMRKRCGNCRPLRAVRDRPTAGVSFFVAAVLPVGLIPGIVNVGRRTEDSGYLGRGHDSQRKTRSQTIEDSYGSIWTSPSSADTTPVSRWRSWHHACLIMIKRCSRTCLKVFTRRRHTPHGVCGIRSPGCSLNAMLCQRPFPERWPPGACSACSCK